MKKNNMIVIEPLHYDMRLGEEIFDLSEVDTEFKSLASLISDMGGRIVVERGKVRIEGGNDVYAYIVQAELHYIRGHVDKGGLNKFLLAKDWSKEFLFQEIKELIEEVKDKKQFNTTYQDILNHIYASWKLSISGD